MWHLINIMLDLWNQIKTYLLHINKYNDQLNKNTVQWHNKGEHEACAWDDLLLIYYSKQVHINTEINLFHNKIETKPLA